MFVNRELLVRVTEVADVPSPPGPWTVTVPAFPLATFPLRTFVLLLLEISALLVRVSVPTFTVMPPAVPLLLVLVVIVLVAFLFLLAVYPFRGRL